MGFKKKPKKIFWSEYENLFIFAFIKKYHQRAGCDLADMLYDAKLLDESRTPIAIRQHVYKLRTLESELVTPDSVHDFRT